jgi:hypothetical protein
MMKVTLRLLTFPAVSRTVKLFVSLSATTIIEGRPTEAGNACPMSVFTFSGSAFEIKKVRTTNC